uniref:Peroxin-19 n=1 Tax=Plectus sambesii TaxID=2011161 RepID=A0A914W4Q1_9BILA
MSEKEKPSEASSASKAEGAAAAPDAAGNVDQELSSLLDSALQDFGKAKPAEEGGAASTAASGMITGHPDFDPMMGFMDQAAAQKAAQDFQMMLSQLAQVQKSVFEQIQSQHPGEGDGAAAAAATMTAADPMQMPTLEDFPADQAPDQDSFMKEMQNLQSEDDSQFMPFMAGLMASFLSKDMMYAPVKEMVDKYPTYLQENEEKLDKDTVERYKKQLDIMQKICHEYENEADEKDQEACMRQFDTITQLMQQMQTCGYPPEELVGGLPPGWSFDASTGMPKLEDANQASESCCVM